MGAPSARVCIVSNSDPVGMIPGGIDAFVRGLVEYAPDDIEMQVLGLSTDPQKRPVGVWSDLILGQKPFKFYAALALVDHGKRPRIPVSLRSLLITWLKRPKVDANVLEFHRFEVTLPFLSHPAAKTAFVHQHMKNIADRGSDMRWKHAPGLYRRLEDWVVPKLSSLYAVREDAALDYKERYPALAPHIHFCPTWFEPRVFGRLSDVDVANARQVLRASLSFPPDSQVLIAVGRLDTQKNPLMLVEAFAQVCQSNDKARLVFVGDGILREDVESRLKTLGLFEKVALVGLKKPHEIVQLINGSDLYALSSDYEGMPIALLEGLACGAPAVATDVGEVKRVVKPGVNGFVVSSQDVMGFAESCLRILVNNEVTAGQHIAQSVKQFTPSEVLEPVFENYRRLARG